MTDSALHLLDDQLLLYASGELTASSAKSAGRHLQECDPCRTRLEKLEHAMGEFAQARGFDQELPSAVGPRALLKAQIARLSTPDGSRREDAKRTSWLLWPTLLSWRRSTVLASLVLLVVLAGSRVWRRTATNIASTGDVAFAGLTEKPDSRFTPGAVIATARNQVCSPSTEASAAIPAAMKSRVLQLYGVVSGPSDAYEVDYLITPELGGATDIRNLWPEPYDHTEWNARVKDHLENRLREMVCHGDLDLDTAQRDISTDWIAAYKKYFHTNTPLPLSS